MSPANSKTKDCKDFQVGKYACVSIGPTQKGIPQGLPCTRYIMMNKGEGCYNVAKWADIGLADFIAWN